MFKKLVAMIVAIETREDFDTACGTIDNAFHHEKINWKDHELLYGLIGKIAIHCE